MKRFWTQRSGPVKIGLVLGVLGALLTVVGLFAGDFAPLTLRTLVLGILLGGGSWGIVSWAIAAAADDAVADDAVAADAVADGAVADNAGVDERQDAGPGEEAPA